MAPERMAKKVKNWKQPESWTRSIRRPKFRWRDGIKKHLNRIGITDLEEADKLVQDRLGWREKIHNLKD
jgi:hypothetical protein